MVTDPRTLRAMVRRGLIEWEPQSERHWTGMTVRRSWVWPGPRLENPSAPFKYRGREYRLEYVDGCFHRFVFRAGEQRPAFV